MLKNQQLWLGNTIIWTKTMPITYSQKIFCEYMYIISSARTFVCLFVSVYHSSTQFSTQFSSNRHETGPRHSLGPREWNRIGKVALHHSCFYFVRSNFFFEFLCVLDNFESYEWQSSPAGLSWSTAKRQLRLLISKRIIMFHSRYLIFN